MAAPIVIETRLQPADIAASAQQIIKPIKSAVDAIQAEAKRAAQQVKTNLTAGFQEAARIAEQLRAARQSKEQAAEAQHQRRITEIAAREAAQRRIIEAREQAQINALREKAAQDEERRQRRLLNNGSGILAFFKRYSSTVREAGESIQQAGFALTGLSALLINLGRTSLRSAIEVDRSRQVLVALTGSTEKANAKLGELRQLAQQTPGLTASVANSVFAQLAATGKIADATINQVLKSIGRLNAVFTIDQPDAFARNIVQIFTQGFERADIKEALGRVPIFEQLLESAFGTKDAAKLKAAKEAGKLTLDTYLSGISDAVQNDARFKSIQESLGTRLQKAQDELLTTLAPLGAKLAETILPILQRLVPVVTDLIDRFSKLSPATQDLIIKAGFLAAALGPVLFTVGSLVQLAGALGNLVTVFSSLGGAAGGLRLAFLGLNPITLAATFALVGLGIAAFETQNKLDAAIHGINSSLNQGLVQAEARRGRLKELAKDAGINLPQQSEIDLSTIPKEVFNAPIVKGSALSLLTGEPVKPTCGKLDFSKLGGKAGDGQRRKELTEAQQLSRELKELNKDIESLRNVTSQEFQLRLRVDRAKEAKQDLQEILELRRELGLPLNLPVGDERATVQRLRQIKELNEGKFVVPGTAPPGIGLAGPSGGTDPLSPEAVQRFERLNALDRQGAQDALIRAQLGQQEASIQNQIALGVLTEAEGRKAILATQAQFRDQLLAALEAQRQLAKESKDFTRIAEIDAQIESIRLLGVELSNAQSFMKGFGRETETVGDIFERFGSNVAQSFRSIRGLVDGLKNSFKQLFLDLAGNALQNSVRSVFGAIFGGARGGGGSPGGIFGTPVFNPSAGSGAGSAFGGITGSLGSIFGGGGISAPGSASGVGGIPNLGAVGGTPGFTPGPPGLSGGGFGGIFGNLGNLGSLFRGIGFGLPTGSTRGGLASALPLLGLGLGAGIGGGGFGSILGGLGGGLLGVGLTAAPAGTPAALAGLFSNPITAVIGAALLPAAFLFGRARQRRADERTSGDSLQRAIDAIFSLKRDIAGDQFNGAEARSIFEDQILAQFIAEINQIKTRSVRESRLTNQVRDLRNLFEQVVSPEITAQTARVARRAAADEIFGKLIPEFNRGGIVPGRDLGYDSVVALMRPNEMVLTTQHQRDIKSIAGNDVFNRVGVPGAGQQAGDAQAFAFGGIAQRQIAFGQGSQVIVIEELILMHGMSQSGAEEIAVRGLSGDRGQQVIVNKVKSARLNREL